MSKRHHPKQVAKVEQLLNGERNSLSLIAYSSEARYLERKYPVKLHHSGFISGVSGLHWFKVKKA